MGHAAEVLASKPSETVNVSISIKAVRITLLCVPRLLTRKQNITSTF